MNKEYELFMEKDAGKAKWFLKKAEPFDPMNGMNAELHLQAVCGANAVIVPKLTLHEDRQILAINLKGRYSPGLIEVWRQHCRGPGPKTMSYPGFWHDLTVTGVAMHELGHHFSAAKGWKDTRKLMHRVAMSLEPPLNAYASTNPQEDFAESFSLYMLNPSLLESVAPKRFALLRDALQLKSPESRGWEEILKDSPRHLEEVRRRLG